MNGSNPIIVHFLYPRLFLNKYDIFVWSSVIYNKYDNLWRYFLIIGLKVGLKDPYLMYAFLYATLVLFAKT